MKHRGVRQTFISALPTLLRLARKPGGSAAILGCRDLPRLHAVPEGAAEIADLDWSHCPLDLLTLPEFGAVADLDRLAKVAPLSGWPERYAAWVVHGILGLRAARGEV